MSFTRPLCADSLLYWETTSPFFKEYNSIEPDNVPKAIVSLLCLSLLVPILLFKLSLLDGLLSLPLVKDDVDVFLFRELKLRKWQLGMKHGLLIDNIGCTLGMITK